MSRTRRAMTARGPGTRGTVLLSQPPETSDVENDPLDFSPVKRKRRQTQRQRKSSRIADKAGPSGWKHADEGDERDLVPPSDDEEYEAWKEVKATQATQAFRASSTQQLSTNASQSIASDSQEIPSTQPLSYSFSLNTSPTIPLSLDDDDDVPDTRLEIRTEHEGDDFMDWGQSSAAGTPVDEWPKLFSSPPLDPSGPMSQHGPIAVDPPLLSPDAHVRSPSIAGQMDREAPSTSSKAPADGSLSDDEGMAGHHAADSGSTQPASDQRSNYPSVTPFVPLVDYPMSIEPPATGDLDDPASPLPLSLAAGPMSPLLRPSFHPSHPSDSSQPTPLAQAIRQTSQSSGPFPRQKSPSLSPVPSVRRPVIPDDPELSRFRNARTFRTRTVLQLQPYTRERQMYEAALRKGGLKKGKKAVAAAREISEDEEEDEDPEAAQSSQPSQSDGDPERIVIGDTASPRPRRRVRPPVEVLDVDRDEYYLQFGSTPRDDTADDFQKLQRIARGRRKAEKEERRKAREAERLRRDFEQVLDGEGQVSPNPIRQHSSRKSLSEKRRTYAGRRQEERRLKRIHSSDGNSDPAELVGRVQQDSPNAAITRSTHEPEDLSERMAPSGIFPTSGMDGLADDHFDHFDYGATEPSESDFGESRQGPPVLEAEEVSSSGSSEELDPRERIARRMMPAAMLKRLLREEERRERRKVEQRRHSGHHASPRRPGRAVVRIDRTDNRPLNLDDLLGDSDSSSSQDVQRQATPASPLVQRELIVIEDDDSSDGSQAHEDNGRPPALARLYEGDFESIVTGNYPLAQARRSRKDSTFARYRPSRHRPHRDHSEASTRKRPGYHFQTRLEPHLVRISPKGNSRRTHSTARRLGKQRKRVLHQSARKRPLIHLDDQTIFSEDVFTSPPDSENIPVDTTLTEHHSKAAPSTLPSQPLDIGIGKARSWANLAEFSKDFGIQPLPSGLYCGDNAHASRGSILQFTRFLRADLPSIEPVSACSSYGIDLQWDMSPSTICSVVPLLFGKLEEQAFEVINGNEGVECEIDFLDFLSRYTFHHQDDQEDDIRALHHACVQSCTETSERLDVAFTRSGRTPQRSKEEMLRVRWSMLRLAGSLGKSTLGGEDGDVLFVKCAKSLIRQLLRCGFDATIRALKDIITGSAQTGEVEDVSITTWVAVIRSLGAWYHGKGTTDSFLAVLQEALDQTFRFDKTGPLAAERIWFINFGLCALSQFGDDGRISSVFVPQPRWELVRRALSLIKIASNEELENGANVEQLRGRDRYIKVMIARCVRLSAVWKWSFDRSSFTVVTKDLGMIFKDRQYRNFPTEPAVDFPRFVTQYDMSLTAEPDSDNETSFELFLRLICVAASDLIGSAESLEAAQQAEKDVQRLILSIIPVSPVKFSRIFPPTAQQLGQLINRYAIMVAACFFSPSLLAWLLTNSKRWAPFEQADFDSRQICIRGLMYVSIACRHHSVPLSPIMQRLAQMLVTLQKELDVARSTVTAPHAPSVMEVERTMVLIVACCRQVIKHHTYDPEKQVQPVYPDPCLLDESWTLRVFSLDLANETRCGMEVIATIQAYLDARAAALPRLAQQRRDARMESQDEFSFGIDLNAMDLAALGDDLALKKDPVQEQDEEFGKIITGVISPQIYRLLSNMLPLVEDEDALLSGNKRAERDAFIASLTKCWVNCAQIVVVEHNSPDGWTPYIGTFGKESWQRLRNERGRYQVGLRFMLNVATLDPGAFAHHEEEFISLLFQALVSERVTIEHEFVSAFLRMPGVADNGLLTGLSDIPGYTIGDELQEDRFYDVREAFLESIFSAVPSVLRSPYTTAATKTLVYRSINLMVSAMISNRNRITDAQVILRDSYQAFTTRIVRLLQDSAGDFISTSSVPSLKEVLVA